VPSVANIAHFTPRAGLDARTNLRRFIDLCRNQLTVFGTNLSFDENVWDVTDFVQRNGKVSRLRIHYSMAPLGRRRGPGMVFEEPYLSFAKAYMRYEFPHRGIWFISRGIRALRVLYRAMIEQAGATGPADITCETLNRSMQMLDGVGPFSVWEIGQEIEKLAVFLVKNHLATVPLDWTNPSDGPGMSHSARVGREFDELRGRMLPSPEALGALAQIFRKATDPDDVLVTSIMAILCSAPSRIGEVLQLSVDCEVVQYDSRGVAVYGLRWYPEKGGAPQTKTIVTSMVDVVREALSKVRALTEPARIAAAWYERHPTEIYLPPSVTHLRDRPTLNSQEVAQILFTEPAKTDSIRVWGKGHNIKRRTPIAVGMPAPYAFRDVEAAVVKKLPRGFPFVNKKIGLRYSHALFCYQRNLRARNKPTYHGAIDLIGINDLPRSLSTDKVSIFDRFGYFEKDGSPIRLRTHQLRHYLNTMAQAGGLGQLDVALWSGRADIHQNSVYDHVSDKDALAILEDNIQDDKHVLPTLAARRRAILIKRDEFARLQVKTAHTTEFGFCVHDFAMLPCQLHMDCLNCDEHLCLKGDRVRNENLLQWRNETKTLLEHSKTAESAELEGADRWTEHQMRTLTRVEEILEIYEDRTVPNGAVIQPASGSVASRIARDSGEHRRLEQFDLETPPNTAQKDDGL
jgi:hypothetical protein